MNASIGRILIILLLAQGACFAVDAAEPNNKQTPKEGGTAVDKSSKKTSPLMDKIKEVGNDVSRGINRASQGVRNVGDKAGKKTKDSEKEK